MKKMRFLLTTLLFATFAVTACNNNNQPVDPEPGPVDSSKDPSLSVTKKTIKVDEEFTLTINNVPDEVTPVWSVQGTAVTFTLTSMVRANAATVKGVEVGKATLTIMVGEKTLTCEVTVNEKGIDPDKPNPDGTYTAYLDLGPIGLYEGKVGQDCPEVFLENAIKFTGQVGDALPGADKITSTSGATFVSWMRYEGDGSPKAYTTLPAINGIILLANFEGGQGTDPGPGPVDPPEGDVTYVLTNTNSWDVFVDGAKVYAWVWGGSYNTGEWIACTRVSDNQLTFTADSSATGCKIVRFASSVESPDWTATIWNQSGDITLAGTSAVNYSIS